ncbi:MAG TPA: hypothetical protein DCE41_36210 [Cytophagales bacterium]|nr:hypothetical protein [Cytophagales bacterium]HAA21762.1 hypothetical protein [Cytophagales bacterium]HAP60052.1 hypothetical protein [Cytophagales bacterium]
MYQAKPGLSLDLEWNKTLSSNPMNVVEVKLRSLATFGVWLIGTLALAGCYPVDTFQASVTVSATQSPVWEEGEMGEFTVLFSLLNSTGDTISVPYQVSGTAQAGVDYETLPAAIQIAPQQSSGSIPVIVLNDQQIENPETVIITLEDEGLPLGVTLVQSALSDTVVIEDNDPEEPDINLLSASVAQDTIVEGEEIAVSFSLETPFSGETPLVIPLNVSGSATAEVDFTPVPSSIVFQSGEAVTSFTIVSSDDEETEAPETITLTLDEQNLPDHMALAGSGSATLVLSDNDQKSEEEVDLFSATISILASEPTASEGGANGTFTFQLDTTNYSGESLLIPYQVSGSATAGSDYSRLSGLATISIEASSVTVLIAVIDDTEVESDETVVVTLDTDRLPNRVMGGSVTSATVTIVDNEFTSTVSLEALESTAAEGGSDGAFKISLEKANDTEADILIPYLVGGTAQNGTDYSFLDGVARIAPGALSVDLSVEVSDDLAQEGNETVLITLDTQQLPAGITAIGTTELRFDIVDNDASAEPKTWVFILAGQSNMAGRAEIEEEDLETNPRILSMRRSGKIGLAQNPLHNYEPGKNALGPGLPFAKALLEHLPPEDTILLVPTAIGGTTVNMWLNDVEHKNYSLLTNFSDKVKLAQERGSIQGILWYQGESDALQENFDSYEIEFPMLIEQFRELCGRENLPILTGDLPLFTTSPTQFNRLNDLMNATVQRDAFLYGVDSEGLTHIGDFFHIDSEGQRLLGSKYAEVVKAIYGLD